MLGAGKRGTRLQDVGSGGAFRISSELSHL